MAKTYVEFEVYADNIFGSDVVVKDTFEEAIECAVKWSNESADVDIIIEKVERTPSIKVFRKGVEVA